MKKYSQQVNHQLNSVKTTEKHHLCLSTTQPNINLLIGKPKKRKLTPSETEDLRLIQVYIQVMNNDRVIETIKAAIDTQSNVSYAKKRLGKKRPWKQSEYRLVKGIGGYQYSSDPITVKVIKGRQIIKINARTPCEGMFEEEDGPELLLSAQHCAELGIDINSAMKYLLHKRVKFLKTASSPPPNDSYQSCYLAEKKMAEYMKLTGGTDKQPVQCSIKDVKINDIFSEGQKQQIRDICEKYQTVFADSPDDIPPIMKNIKPHVFKTKEGSEPVYCRKPNWGPATRKFLTQWTEKALQQGLMEPAPDSQWASRVVLVPKYRGNKAKGDTPDDIRVCVDFTAINERILKQPPQYPDPYEEMRKASGHLYYFQADGQKQFNSIPLAETSRDMTTTWTPLGLMRWKRLIMGTKDASGRAQQEYSNSMSRFLPGEIHDHIVNFQDDFLGFHNDKSKLIEIFEEFLKMCFKAGITLNPAKISIGTNKAKFYGFHLNKEGISPSERNLDPVKKMTSPTNRKQLRSVLGVFNQFRHFFQRYDRLTTTMQKLLRKNVPWVWSTEAENNFQHIRKELMTGKMYLAAQNRKHPLILETDGSDDGWGAILLQLINGQRRVIKMWSKQWKTMHMKRAPPYYKETAAWMKGMELARIYADYSPYPIQCITDHIPLTYVKSTSGKGPVSQFVLDNLGSLDYTLTYRKGINLVEADAVSRFPCLGPKILAPDGMREAFDILIAALPMGWKPKGTIWVNALKETEFMKQMIMQWVSLFKDPPGAPKRLTPVTERPTVDRIKKIDYGLGIWAPPADNITELLDEALTKDKPFACLVPSCLIHRTPSNKVNRSRLRQASKLVLLDPEMTWVVYGIPTMKHNVYPANMKQNTFGHLTDLRGIIRRGLEFKAEDWVPGQQSLVKEHPDIYTDKAIHPRKSDGFVLYRPTPDETRAVVPKNKIKPLVIWQHQALCHGGHAKVYAALRKHYHWPTMKRDIRLLVQDCAACQLLKAKRNTAHQHFRSKVFCTPRTSWGCDYYGVAISKKGYNNILGAIDLATAECRLFACKGRTAAITTDCILDGIVLRDGCPLRLHSDAAREFLSKSLKRLCKLLGCNQTSTLAHH
ncbi:MAG: hypothetical protein GY816_00290, partial [Cytophagales bacterium]|nr:hypothetical protein [Cytophagales bacterium]